MKSPVWFDLLKIYFKTFTVYFRLNYTWDITNDGFDIWIKLFLKLKFIFSNFGNHFILGLFYQVSKPNELRQEALRLIAYNDILYVSSKF